MCMRRSASGATLAAQPQQRQRLQDRQTSRNAFAPLAARSSRGIGRLTSGIVVKTHCRKIAARLS
jgi:hypothetical protein